jgi:hypothetical protein
MKKGVKRRRLWLVTSLHGRVSFSHGVHRAASRRVHAPRDAATELRIYGRLGAIRNCRARQLVGSARSLAPAVRFKRRFRTSAQRSQPRGVMVAANSKGPADMPPGPARKDNVSLPVAPYGPPPGRDETNIIGMSLRCGVPFVVTGRAGVRTLRCAGMSVRCAQMNTQLRTGGDMLRGGRGAAPVTRACWGGVFVAQYRDSLSWPLAASPLTRVPSIGHRCARLR